MIEYDRRPLRERMKCANRRLSPPSKQGGFLLNPFRFGAAGGSAYYTAIMALSPRGYWRLGEASGTTAVDSSGNGRNGTYTGNGTPASPGATGLVSGDADNAGTFPAGSAVDIPYGSWMNSGIAFSTTMIVNGTVFGGALMGRRNSAADSTETAWVIRNNGLLIRDTTSPIFDFSALSAAPSTGVTYHYVHSYSPGGTISLYRQGLLVFAKKYFVTTSQPTAGSIQLMANKSGSTTYAETTQGVGDEFAFFGTALTAANAYNLASIAGLAGTQWTFDNACATARAVWALRGINGYIGALIDVRRSSDNATRTISVASGELDTADLATWGGSDSVYVSKLYDQSGNGHHQLQATNGSQPRIVNAGTLHTQNGKPVIDFSGGNWWMEDNTGLIGTTDSFTIAGMFLSPFGIGRGLDTFGNGWSLMFNGTRSEVVFDALGAAGIGTNIRTATSTWTSRACQCKNVASASAITALEDGFELANNDGRVTSTNSSLRTSTKGFILGRYSTGYTGGKFAEAMVWRTLTTHGELDAIRTDQHTRFGAAL